MTDQVSPCFSVEAKKVGGLLAFFCLTLTVFHPAFQVYSILSNLLFVAEIKKNVALTQQVISAIVILSNSQNFFSIMSVAFSVYCGILLWQIKSTAIVRTKAFLWYLVAVQIILLAMVYLLSLPTELESRFAEEVGKSVTGQAFASSLWHYYLNKSERVRNTFHVYNTH